MTLRHADEPSCRVAKDRAAGGDIVFNLGELDSQRAADDFRDGGALR
jgi:hypothetical protein